MQLKILIVRYFIRGYGYGDALIQGSTVLKQSIFVFLMLMDLFIKKLGDMYKQLNDLNFDLYLAQDI